MNLQYKTELDFFGEQCKAIINVEVEHYEHIPGIYREGAASDMDYMGWEDLQFAIESVTWIDGKGIEVFTDSRELIDELVTDAVYSKLFDWVTEQMRKGE